MWKKKLPKQQELVNLLDYSPETGYFFWKARPKKGRSNWNERWAGKEAGVSIPDGYKLISVHGCKYLASRLAYVYVYGDVLSPENDIDHKDRDPANCRINNLRVATRSQNLANSGPRQRNQVGLKGVSKKRGRYRARISCGYRNVQIGTFDTAQEAHAAYAREAAKYFGEFART